MIRKKPDLAKALRKIASHFELQIVIRFNYDSEISGGVALGGWWHGREKCLYEFDVSRFVKARSVSELHGKLIHAVRKFIIENWAQEYKWRALRNLAQIRRGEEPRDYY